MPLIASKHYIAQTQFLFHCHIKVKIPATYSQEVLDSCFTLLHSINSTYNSYEPTSYFAKINANAGNYTSVDATTVTLVKQLKETAAITNGVYDVTAMPLIKLWGFYKKEQTAIPSQLAIDQELKKVDFTKIEIKENSIKIGRDQEIITGSFIKAYAVDCLVTHLKNLGITNAIINAGGSTIYALADQSHPSWKVNIPHPEDSNKKTTITLSNECFSLSARAHNHITIGNKTYGHIINAKTGYPSDNLQVGVISKSAFVGDVYSTALFSLPTQLFKKTAEALANKHNIKAYLITGNHQFQQLNFQ